MAAIRVLLVFAIGARAVVAVFIALELDGLARIEREVFTRRYVGENDVFVRGQRLIAMQGGHCGRIPDPEGNPWGRNRAAQQGNPHLVKWQRDPP